MISEVSMGDSFQGEVMRVESTSYPTGIARPSCSPLKTARLRRGETLQEVADAIGSNTGNLSRIERGQVPNSRLTAKIVKHFGGEISDMQIICPERATRPDLKAA